MNVYTTTVKDYAENVCQHLHIKPVELFSREDCLIADDSYVKSVPDYYYDNYEEITIIDDIPSVWDKKTRDRCKVNGVPPFTGDDGDEEPIKSKKWEFI